MKIEQEYRRCGAWPHGMMPRAKLFGRCKARNGIAPFDRLVDPVMSQPPYSQARRVSWILDSCSAHRTPGCVCPFIRKQP